MWSFTYKTKNMLKLDCQLDFKKKKLTRKIVFFPSNYFFSVGEKLFRNSIRLSKGIFRPFFAWKIIGEKKASWLLQIFLSKSFCVKKDQKSVFMWLKREPSFLQIFTLWRKQILLQSLKTLLNRNKTLKETD